MKIRMKFNRRMSANEVRAFEERKAAKERGEAVEKRTVKRRGYGQQEESAGRDWESGKEYSAGEPSGRRKPAGREDEWESSEYSSRWERTGQEHRSGKKDRRDSGGRQAGSDKAGRRDGIGRGDSMGYKESAGRRDKSGRRDSMGYEESAGRRDKSGRRDGMGYEESAGRRDGMGYEESTGRRDKSGRRGDMDRAGKSGRRDGMGREENTGRRGDMDRAGKSGRRESAGRRAAGAGKVKGLWNTGRILPRKQKPEPEYDEYLDADDLDAGRAGIGNSQSGFERTGWDRAGMEEENYEQTGRGNAGEQHPEEQAPENMGAAGEPDASLPKIEGRNAVLEAFRAGKTIDKLFVLEGCKDGPVQTILREAKKHDTIINFVDKERLIRMSGTKKHQGVIAVTAAYEYASVDDILQKAEDAGEQPFLILLDSIEDPHNLGAIIRTANLAGAHGVIIPKRRAVGLTGAVAKASAGAINYTPVAKVTNLNQTIKELKERGIWFVCADMEGEQMYRQNLTGPIGLVIGAEGAGVSRLVKENCDFTASIPMKGEIGSLNASTAAAVLAYEIVRQREFSNK